MSVGYEWAQTLEGRERIAEVIKNHERYGLVIEALKQDRNLAEWERNKKTIDEMVREIKAREVQKSIDDIFNNRKKII